MKLSKTKSPWYRLIAFAVDVRYELSRSSTAVTEAPTDHIITMTVAEQRRKYAQPTESRVVEEVGELLAAVVPVVPVVPVAEGAEVAVAPDEASDA